MSSQSESVTINPRFNYTIKVAQLDGKTRLDDGDVISIVEETTGRVPGTITFTLAMHKGKWWKGIVSFRARADNDWREVAAGTGDELNDPKYTRSKGSLSQGDLDSGYLVLSKAKGMGVHANMYLLQDAFSAFTSGSHYKVTWLED